MCRIIQYLKNKKICRKYKKNGCDGCPHDVNGHDWWGCSLGFRP